MHSSFIDNVWVLDFAHMQLLSKFNKRKGITKKGITITNAF